MLGCSTRVYWRCRNGSTSSKRNSPKRERRNDVQRRSRKRDASASLFSVLSKSTSGQSFRVLTRTIRSRDYHRFAFGTKRTNRTGLMMSVDRGRSEVAGNGSNGAFDPYVWSGRALQEGSSSWRSAVLHQCIRSLIGAVLLRTNMDISAHAISLADRPRRAFWVTSVRTRREDRSSISSHSLADLGG